MAVTSDVFTWENGVGYGELSTVEGNGGFFKKDQSKLFVKSEKTGCVLCLSKSKANAENGEIVSFEYTNSNPGLDHIKIVLFND